MAIDHNDENRSLEETAILPEDDPRRLELERVLDDGSDSLREEWFAILSENEDLRLRLRGVEVPSGLVARVRSVREGNRPVLRHRSILPVASIFAAVMLLAAIISFVIVLRGSAGPADSAIRELAMLAVMDHAARPVLSIETEDLDTLAVAIHSDTPFNLLLSSPEPGAVLMGGRVCKFGERPLVYTCWRVGGEDVALYQVRRSEFGLSAGLQPRNIDIPKHGSAVSRCRVRVWTDAEFAYVVVHDNRQHGG